MTTWEPHKRRGPIAAEYSSPGPCYGLPTLVGVTSHDTRSVHWKAPAYSFGLKRAKFADDCSPGPKYLPDSKVFRDGADGTPHYSLSSRHKDLSRLIVPGPGAYSPENSGQQAYFRHPEYSFGSRNRSRKSDMVPAPNNYTLPTMLSKTYQSGKPQAPCFSMVGRSKIGSFHEDLRKTPGPGTYSVTAPDTYKDKAPQYSTTARNVMPGDTTQKPGPGAHNLCDPGTIKQKAPAYTFGIRHTQYEAPLIIEVEEF